MTSVAIGALRVNTMIHFLLIFYRRFTVQQEWFTVFLQEKAVPDKVGNL